MKINYKVFTLMLAVLVVVEMIIGVYASVIDPGAQGYNSRTYATNYEMLVQSFNTLNVTPVQSIAGAQYALPPFYSSSSSCGPSDFHSSCGFSGNLTNYCLVSDETSQWALTLSMTQNTSMNDEFNAMINTILAWNISSTNSLTEWKTGYHAQSGGIINKSIVTDTASDADARFITALLIANSSDSPFNASTKARAGSLGGDMCSDFIANEFLNIARTSNSNASYTINYWPCGGMNVCTQLTNNDFMFTGYHGDIAITLEKCGEFLNNSQYFDIARDTVESYLAASNWTPTSGLKFPPGRSYKWANAGAGQTPYAVDTSGVPYVDDPDGKRITSLCTAEYIFNEKGRVLHPQLTKYCQDWATQSVITNTTYPAEWRAEGTNFSASTDSFSNNGLALQLDIYKNQSRAVQRLNYTFNNKWDNTNMRYFGTSCQGLYNPSFVAHSMGYLLGYGNQVQSGPSPPAVTTFSSILFNITAPSNGMATQNASLNFTGLLTLANYSINFNNGSTRLDGYNTNNETGFYMYVNRNFTATGMLYNDSSGGNKLTIRNASGFSLLNASMGGGISTFNYNFTKGAFYFVQMFHHTLTNTVCRTTPNFPENHSFFDVINGSFNTVQNSSSYCVFNQFQIRDHNPFKNTTLFVYHSNGTLSRMVNQVYTLNLNVSYLQNLSGLSSGSYNWHLYSCQSNGACNTSENRSFSSGAFLFDMRSVNNTGEGVINPFSINLSMPSGFPVNAQLVYNNTQYSGTITNYAPNNYKFSTTVLSPNIASGSVQIPWIWNVSLNSGGILQSSMVNQTVTALSIDDCSVNTVRILNLTLRDEDTQSLIIPNGVTLNNTIEVDLDIYPQGSNVLITEFARNYTNSTMAQVCIPTGILNSSSYVMDAVVRYESTTRISEFYNIRTFNLSNATVPNNINLYDLLITSSQEFLITVKDENFLPLEGAVLFIQRKYIDEGVFKTVEAPITDDNGQALAHLVLGDVIYTIVVVKDGVTRGTFTNQVAKCQDQTIGRCEITLNLLSSGTLPINISAFGDIAYTFSVNRTTRTIFADFITLSGNSRTVTLNATLFSRTNGALVCEDTLSGSSGQLACVASGPYQNATVLYALYSNGMEVGRGSLSLSPSIFEQDKEAAFLILIFIYIFFATVGLTTGPTGAIILNCLGLIIGFLFQLYQGFTLIGVGSYIVYFIMIVLIITMQKRSGSLD